MNGATNLSSASQAPASKDQPGTWAKEDELILLDRIRCLLPEDDCMKFKTTESHLDWEKVRFGTYTGAICKQKWLKLSMEVRKFRTMTELIADAMEVVRNPYKGKKLKVNMKAYLEAHPHSAREQLVKSVLNTAERQLKDQLDGRPTKPPLNGYSLYCTELMVNMNELPSMERMVLCSRRWKMMSQKEKDMYQKLCEQKKKQYDSDMQRFLQSLPEEEREQVSVEEKLGTTRSTSLGQGVSPPTANPPTLRRELAEMRSSASAQAAKKLKFNGEPKKPPTSGYQMFSQELLTNGELNHLSLKERMVEIGKRWQRLSAPQKDGYKKMVEEQQIGYKAELDSWVQSLSAAERSAYKEYANAKRRVSSKPATVPSKKKKETSDDDDEEQSDSDTGDEDDSSASSDSDDDDDNEVLD